MKKKFMAAFLAVCMIATMLVIPANAASFPDTDGHWAASSIERWSDAKVLNGNADGTFNPDGAMTRAEYVKFLAENLLGYSAKAENVFTDVPAGSWYEDAVLKAVAAGVTTGTSATTFGPTNAVTFEQASVLLFRALGLVKVVGGTNYADDTRKLLEEMEITDTEHVNANGDCTRAVVAALTDRVIGEYVTSDTVIDKDVKGVVVAVNGAKVEIKDATVSASVVAADGASVTLTNATAGNVVVGDKATVTADEKSAVKDVTMIGDAPKADIKGSVDSLTVGETATGAVADVPAGTTTENKSASEATINGEAVAGVDPDQTPDNTAKDPELAEGAVVDGGSEVTGTVPGSHTHVWIATQQEDGTTHKNVCAVCGTIEQNAEGNADKSYTCAENAVYSNITETTHYGVCPCGRVVANNVAHELTEANNYTCKCGYKISETDGDSTKHGSATSEEIATAHTIGEAAENKMVLTSTDAASCTAAGKKVYTCSVCGYKKTITIPATGHTPDPETLTDTATCTKAGTKSYTCATCGVKVSNVASPATGEHVYTNSKMAPTGTNQHHIVCETCGLAKADSNPLVDCFGAGKTYKVNGGQHIVTCVCGRTKTEAHTWVRDDTVEPTAAGHTEKCACGATRVVAHNFSNGVCDDCGYVTSAGLDALEATMNAKKAALEAAVATLATKTQAVTEATTAKSDAQTAFDSATCNCGNTGSCNCDGATCDGTSESCPKVAAKTTLVAKTTALETAEREKTAAEAAKGEAQTAYDEAKAAYIAAGGTDPDAPSAPGVG